jgi:hypothetical protein
MSKLLAFVCLLTFPLLAAGAQAESITLHLWCELEPMIAEEEEYPLRREEAYRRILEEARRLLSAMIYGVKFSYVPADSQRSISENLTLSTVAEIPWGDPQLQVLELETRDKRLYARVEYRLRDYQHARREAWSSNILPLAAGRGAGDLFGGVSEKQRSLEDAMRMAIRNHLRPILFNKPREVNGELMIWREPATVISSGSYLTEVQVKLKVEEVRAYGIF